MILRDIKNNMLLPDREILLFHEVEINGQYVLVASITSQGGKNSLWVLYSCPEQTEICWEESLTNRQSMLKRMEMAEKHQRISEISVQGQRMKFGESRYYDTSDAQCMAYMYLQHFIEKGLPKNFFEKNEEQELVFACHMQEEDGIFPEIDPSKALDIKMKIQADSVEIPLERPLKFQLHIEEEDGNKYSFFNVHTQRESCFFINKIEKFDLWEHTRQILAHERRLQYYKENNVAPEEIHEMEEQTWESIAQNCPEDKNMALLVYECEGEEQLQLNFYTSAFLEEEKQNRSSSMGFFGDKELGMNGYRKQYAILSNVDKDFNGEMEVELFSWYLRREEQWL